MELISDSLGRTLHSEYLANLTPNPLFEKQTPSIADGQGDESFYQVARSAKTLPINAKTYCRNFMRISLTASLFSGPFNTHGVFASRITALMAAYEYSNVPLPELTKSELTNLVLETASPNHTLAQLHRELPETPLTSSFKEWLSIIVSHQNYSETDSSFLEALRPLLQGIEFPKA